MVVADIEGPVLERTVAELRSRGAVEGVVTDVSDATSVEALADTVFDRYGACHVLWNNAGVTSGGGGNPWEQEPNDWRWCFGVNVFGTANGVLAFVPRMVASGEPGVVVTTSSGDGGIAPVPYASVYASSKAAISCFTEALAHQFLAQGTNLQAAVFYPSGGLLETGLWEAQRNRPAHLARVRPRPPAPGTTFAEFKAALASAGRPTDGGRPRRARALRRAGGQGREVRHQPQPRRRRPAAARPGRCLRRGPTAAIGPRGPGMTARGTALDPTTRGTP